MKIIIIRFNKVILTSQLHATPLPYVFAKQAKVIPQDFYRIKTHECFQVSGSLQLLNRTIRSSEFVPYVEKIKGTDPLHCCPDYPPPSPFSPPSYTPTLITKVSAPLQEIVQLKITIF